MSSPRISKRRAPITVDSLAIRVLLAPVPSAARPVVLQFAKFGIVGISNTLIMFTVYTLLLKVFDVWYLAASAIGFTVGAINGFLLNRAWTFRGHVGDSLTPVRWGIVQGSGLALDEALLYMWVHGLGVDKLIAQALAIVVVTTTTFFANRAWTFRMTTPASDPARVPGSVTPNRGIRGHGAPRPDAAVGQRTGPSEEPARDPEASPSPEPARASPPDW
jgi:putative flippase GtrA